MANSSELNYYYKLKEDCVEKQKKYKQSLNICNNLLSEISRIKNSLNNIKDNLMTSFTINGKSADDGMTDQIIDNISTIWSLLSGQIVPQIQTEISQLTNKINEYDNQIAYLLKQAKDANEENEG